MGAKDGLIKGTAILSIVFSFIVFSCMLIITTENKVEHVSNSTVETELTQLNYITTFVPVIENTEQTDKKDYLRISLPEGVTEADVKITNTHINKTISITIPRATKSYFQDYPLVGSSDHISSMSFGFVDDSAYIELILDSVYEYQTMYEDGFLYFKFISPKTLYDKIIVIDPGHGGADGGTAAYGVVEKDINLQIGLKLKTMLEKTGIKVFYTRTSDTKPSYEERVGLANDLQSDMLISIHINADKVKSSMGTEVLYNEMEVTSGFGSKDLAEICQEEVTASLGSRNRGLIPGSSIYIVRNAKIPVALIEVGFVTNSIEAKLLTEDSYQMNAARGIFNGIMRAYEQRETVKTQVVDNE